MILLLAFKLVTYWNERVIRTYIFLFFILRFVDFWFWAFLFWNNFDCKFLVLKLYLLLIAFLIVCYISWLFISFLKQSFKNANFLCFFIYVLNILRIIVYFNTVILRDIQFLNVLLLWYFWISSTILIINILIGSMYINIEIKFNLWAVWHILDR